MADEWRLPESYRSSAGTVRWNRLGDPGAPAVVLLHGTPFSSYVWRGLARALARHHLVYVWDMPGYGASEKPEGQDVSLAAERDVFVELLGEWGLAEPAVIAHDSGGAVALGAHLLRGARYFKLALVDAVSLPPWGSAFSQLVGEHADVFGRLPPGPHAALLREYVSSASSPGLHPATLDALVAPWIADGGQQAFYRQLTVRLGDRSYTDSMQERYATIDVPVAVCWGEDDTWVPVERGRELAARIPGARLRIIPGAGHLVQEDRPAELTAALSEFLREDG
ncbi:alpha/beta fold hydrolase [Pseudonocardia sp. MH-G8]|uniref:alpha/beta fold hydrolase n=1 Tax=Pseudonocardia sp. MH-G8 TaxID=1854588 RepID=UPI000BA147F2|nr:alpha/beta hydrolase [Pseudonocardia sp. MH-G8]OZM80042.1 alpha/beta hydrolase [Pseudonocardia sp. MH-G8]